MSGLRFVLQCLPSGILQKVLSGKLALCGDTCRGRAADEKREWKKVSVKFAYVFPFGNRLRGRVLSKLVGKKNSVVGPHASISAARWVPRMGAGRSQQGCRGRSPMPPRQRRRFTVFTYY